MHANRATLSPPFPTRDVRAPAPEGGSFTTETRVITGADVMGFAALTGDWHPQHTDAAWAARSQFGERIAHGMLVASCALGLIGFDPEGVVALRRIKQLVFKRPVAIGDPIRVDVRAGARSRIDDDHDLATYTIRVLKDDGPAVAQASVEVVERRPRPMSAAEHDDDFDEFPDPFPF